MPARTQLFQLLPWNGGVNTSQDDSLISPNQLVRADNCIFDTRGSRKKREGLKYNWDNVTTSNISIRGLHEFWFGEQSKSRRLVSISAERTIRSYTSGGIATTVPVGGKPWTGTIDNASMQTFNNKCIMAVPGAGNLLKYWDGIASSAEDVRNDANLTIAGAGRSSLGTTRTLILSKTFPGVVGEEIVVSDTSGVNAPLYNGTYVVDTIFSTNVSNDTITYIGVGTLNEAPVIDVTLTVWGVAPKASIIREHLGRLWTNDKTNRDRIHFSGAFNHQQWLGFGDSGALDIGVGDGDPEGITAIFPSFKGTLFVAKLTKLYRITGVSPESFNIELVTGGIGCVSHNSIAQIDQDDMMFVSEKGIHSVAATSNFGDFNSTYISADIQRTFNEKFSKPNFKQVWAAYLPTINSVAFTFTDLNLPQTDNTTLQVNNAIWLYNIPFKAWYRWMDVPCQAMIVATDGDRKRFYFGSHTERLVKSFLNNNYDTSYSGAQDPVKFIVETGKINLDGSLYTVKGFKRFILYYKPDGVSSIDVDVQIDSHQLGDSNALVFSDIPSATLLGVDFILGVSELGDDSVLASYTKTIDGYGRACRITITQSDAPNSQIDIQGFAIEFEAAGTSPEVVQST